MYPWSNLFFWTQESGNLSRYTLNSELLLKLLANRPGGKICAISYFGLPSLLPPFIPDYLKADKLPQRVAWGAPPSLSFFHSPYGHQGPMMCLVFLFHLLGM